VAIAFKNHWLARKAVSNQLGAVRTNTILRVAQWSGTSTRPWGIRVENPKAVTPLSRLTVSMSVAGMVTIH
jgi:hypothetical protein